MNKIFLPHLFGTGVNDNAIIFIDLGNGKIGEVHISGKDISRLYFVMSQVMDDADRECVVGDLIARGVIECPEK